jgi:hypothetical protein
MTRLLLVATLVTLVGLATTLSATAGPTELHRDPADSQPPVVVDPELIAPGVPHQVTMRVGDTMVVEDTDLGCQVRRRNERVVIECRRLEQVAGTYMTLITARRAKVARFRSADTAKVILTARHGGGWRACGVGARAAQAGGPGCR